MKTFIKAKETQDGVFVKYRLDNKVFYKNIELQNYFYILYEDFLNIKEHKAFYHAKKLISRATVYNASNGTFVKLYLKNNFDRHYLKDIFDRVGIKTFESDINTVKRFLINNDIIKDFSFGNDVRIVWYDIETDDRGEFEKDTSGTVIAGNKQILSIACLDENDTKFFVYNKNPDDNSLKTEYELFKSFFSFINKYDLLTAWNGSMFDRPYIEQRLNALENKGYDILEFRKIWSMMIHLDELIKFKNLDYNKHASYSLESIANDELGDGKIDFSDDVPKGRGKFYNLFKTNLEKFREYNEKDVLLMKQIDEKRGHFKIARHLSNFTKTPIESFMYNSHILDFLLLRAHHAKHRICKSKPSRSELQKLDTVFVGGGYTFCYKTGFFKNVDVFDFKSHYPLVMATFNISDETVAGVKWPDIYEVKDKFSEIEFEWLKLVFDMSTGVLKHNAKELEKFLVKNNLDGAQIMLKFIEHYTGKQHLEFAKKQNFILSPADLNNDTNGWHFHPHRLYKKEQGELSKLVQNAVVERDKIKYKLWKLKKENPDIIDSQEYIRLDSEQHVLKTLANSAYGFSGLKISRFFDWNVADAITTAARWITKKTILFAQKSGYETIGGDTDSIFLKNKTFKGTTSDMDKEFYKYYTNELFSNFNLEDFNKIEFKNPLTNELKKHHYFCVFEWEKSFDSMIMVAKKRYYFLQNGRVLTQGGAFKKSNTNPLAAKLQKEMVSDILHDKFDESFWYDKIYKYKQKCFSQNLDKEHLIFTVSYTKHWSEFGGEMIDKKTGLPKTKNDGTIRQKNIPAHIVLAKDLEFKGREVQVGDAIQYIIGEPSVVGLKPASRKKADRELFLRFYDVQNIEKSKDILKSNNIDFIELYDTKQRAILYEDLQKGEKYDAKAYWRRIASPLIEILEICIDDFENSKFNKLLKETELEKQKITLNSFI